MTNPSGLSISPQGRTLTAAQKEFNRLTKKIESLRDNIANQEAGALRVQEQVNGVLIPLNQKYNTLKAELVQLLDRSATNYAFKAAEMKKLRWLITDLSPELIEAGFEELKPIFNRHSEQSYEETDAMVEEQTAEVMREMVQRMFGITIDPEADVSTPEKLQAYLDQQLKEREAQATAAHQAREAKKAAKPLTEKQQKAAEKRAEKEKQRQEEEKKVSQSVRTVYMDLVKAFHPDLERDETEKVRKTAIMQRVTAAYEDNNLLGLLKLQLELERIDHTHLESLADERLKLFNKVLRNQVKELEDELDELQYALAMMMNRPSYFAPSAQLLEHYLKEDIKNLKKSIKEASSELNMLADQTNLRAFLKSYRIPKRQTKMGMEDFF